MYSIPTPKASSKNICPGCHRNVKFRALNLLNVDLVDRSDGFKGQMLRYNMQELLPKLIMNQLSLKLSVIELSISL